MSKNLTNDTLIEIVSRLADSEKHFNTIQAGLRGLASTWTLVAFGGLAKVLTQSSLTEYGFPKYLIVTVLCAMASIGILSLWVVDQLVYHRLLNSNFLMGLKIEYDHNYIPPIRALMAESSEGRGMSYWLKVFYLVPILGFGVVAVVFVCVSAYSISLESTSFGFFEWVSVCVAAVPIVSGIWIIRRAQDVSFYLGASLFGDEDFTDLVRKGEYRQIIERFRYPKEEEESEASDTS